MTRISIALSILLVLAAVPVLAENKHAGDGIFNVNTSLLSGELKPTPEMWFYEQQQAQYDDPKAAVRRNAEFKASQRRARLAAMKWFGFSNMRPQCTVTPGFEDWSPVWKSNNSYFGSRWNGTGAPWIAVEPRYPDMRRY